MEMKNRSSKQVHVMCQLWVATSVDKHSIMTALMSVFSKHAMNALSFVISGSVTKYNLANAQVGF